jgi:membrane-associated protein
MAQMHFFALIPMVKLIGYPGLFAVVFLESGVFFGFFLPGASMLFTAGLLASQGFFHPWVLIPLVTLAAILGDSAGYWFGAKVGAPLFARPNSRFFRHEHLEQARDFYEKHGVQAVALARFIPIIRTFAPIVAGIVGMRYKTFLTYNVAGGILWGGGVTFLGYYLGEKVPFVTHYLTAIVVSIIIITLIPLALDILKRHRSRT